MNESSSSNVFCRHASQCSGCTLLNMTDANQLRMKSQDFIEKWTLLMGEEPPLIRTARVAESAFRERADLVFQNGYLSFYQKNSRSTFDMEGCPLLSLPLEKWFHEVKAINWPIKKGSLRLRVSPDGKKGIWLDFANEDIKSLFDEKNLLLKLLNLASVEVGQKRKTLTFDGDRLRLKDPQYFPWISTYWKEQEIPLMTLVGGFSQTGRPALKLITERLQDHLLDTPIGTWFEFGPGNGSLTIPLALSGRQVHGFDVDDRSLEGLKQTLSLEGLRHLSIKLEAGDFQKKRLLSFQNVSGLLVNPPRSGLQNFLDPLGKVSLEARPQTIIYLSCFLDSFLLDARKLAEFGYRLTKIDLIDQFPHTAHAEFLGSFSRN